MQIEFLDRSDTFSDKWDLYRDTSVIPLWVADTDAKVAPAITAALMQRVAHGIYGYTLPSDALIANTINYFASRWQWQIKAEWLVFSAGLGAAIHNVSRMLGQQFTPANSVGQLIPCPIYHQFRYTTGYYGQQRQDVVMALNELQEWELPIANIEAVKNEHSRVLHLCNPHNPNGKVYTRAELEAIADYCLRHKLIICADEVHADIILDEGTPHIPIASLSPEVARQSITLQSPSKAFNIAGLNCAVAVIPDEELRQKYIQATKGHISGHHNIFGMTAVEAAWSGQCDDWLEAMNAVLRDNRDRLKSAVDGITGISMAPLPATYLAWINIEGLRLSCPHQFFVDNGLGLSDGSSFGDARFLRLNFGCSPDVLTEVIARLEKICQKATEVI